MKHFILQLIISSGFIIVSFLALSFLEEIFLVKLNAMTGFQYSYSAISFLILALDVVLPVPSSIVIYTNGFVLGVAIAFLVSMGGLMLGAIIGYYIGQFAHQKNKNTFHDQKIVSKFGLSIILITRGIPILSESICFISGYNNVPIVKYLILNFIGNLPVVLLYSIGGHMGYEQNIFVFTFVCSLLISVLFWTLSKRYLISTMH